MASRGFDAEQLADFKEAFAQIDLDRDGIISGVELGSLLRQFGQNPTEQDLAALAPMGTVTMDRFLEIMSSSSSSLETEADIVRAFRVFDRTNSGYITNTEFRKAMTAYGEKLTDEEVDDILREADSSGTGRINYKQFARQLFAGLSAAK